MDAGCYRAHLSSRDESLTARAALDATKVEELKRRRRGRGSTLERLALPDGEGESTFVRDEDITSDGTSGGELFLSVHAIALWANGNEATTSQFCCVDCASGENFSDHEGRRIQFGDPGRAQDRSAMFVNVRVIFEGLSSDSCSLQAVGWLRR